MIRTFDFVLVAYRDAKLMQAINDAMESQKNEVLCTDMHKLTFFPFKQTVIVEPLSKESPFHYKIVPTEVKYTAIKKMLNHNWDDISEDEIMDITTRNVATSMP